MNDSDDEPDDDQDLDMPAESAGERNGDDNVSLGIATVTTQEEEEEMHNNNITANLDDGMDVDTVVPDHSDEDENASDGEQMRPEVRTAIACYCMTINHPQASAKMIEIALECIGLLISNRYVVGSTMSKAKKEDEDEEHDFEVKDNTSDVMRLINCICECADNVSDAVQSAMAKDLLSLMTSPVCSVHEAGMLKAVRTVFHIYLITKYDDVKKMSREVLLDMLRSVFQRMEAYDAIAQEGSEGGLDDSFELPKSQNNSVLVDEDGGSNNLFASRFHTDSYLLFRALCKLSAKPLPEDADDLIAGNTSSGGNLRVFSGSKSANSDPMATATKILSLELILSVFEHCGTAFRNGEKFIYAVQNFLCVSLLKNCVSSNTTVAHLSLKVFLLLVSDK